MSTSNCNGASKSDDDVCEVNSMLQNMRTADEDDKIDTNICANCGEEGSEVTNTCNKCKMVMYCNAACKKKHRSKHKKECEEHLRLAAEHAAKLHDEALFKQPPIPFEDCPLCFLRLPSKISGSVYMTCCGKVICCGCIHAVKTRTKKHSLCAFCRVPNAISDEDNVERMNRRIYQGDAIALYNIAGCYYRGDKEFKQDVTKALKLYHQAGELGYAPAYNNIGACYNNGEGVEVDKKKAIYYYELAAMAGNEVARHNLGLIEGQAFNYDRALKHFMIAVRDGGSNSLEGIKVLFLNGSATKDDYSKALSAYQTYLGEIRSIQRDEDAAIYGDPYY